ncbi:unnamed protein product [Cladocopium goreaui]|uniref:Histone-lysine N-methyltransferase EHMT1 n=1 Tax=Cladocopium goreaui TaxID=2562237 RepID=A0A9P1CVX6_9DINO|nr:unnamed protein product [Cladocopium goreaui]|mmetsp:Transcript_1571/g.3614  ORF Transcript_1571/g.3614 Transcript_1571/m.3614 type:complete len:229 (-) Transcript_1571:25-711(-)
MVLLYRVFLVALGLLVSGSSSESCEDEQCMSFMQMKLETHHHLDGQAKSAAQGVCLQSMTWETYRKPIRQVVQEHPENDGWCTYGLMGHIFSSCAVARRLQSLEGLQSSAPLEDSYCSVNGWYDLPVDQAASNYSFVELASQKYCDSLGQVLAGAENVSFADVAKMSAEHEDSLAESKELPLPQKLSLQLLGAVKCLLSGHGKSATICDIARCAKRKASDPVVTAPIR